MPLLGSGYLLLEAGKNLQKAMRWTRDGDVRSNIIMRLSWLDALLATCEVAVSSKHGHDHHSVAIGYMQCHIEVAAEIGEEPDNAVVMVRSRALTLRKTHTWA